MRSRSGAILEARPAARARRDDVRDAVFKPAEDRFRQLYARHHAAVRGYALRLSRGGADHADDLVQETFLRAWRHIDDIDDSYGSVRGWLFSTLRHAAIDAWRRTAREQPTDTLPERAVHAAEEEIVTAHLMRQALQRLSDQHSSVLRKTYFAGLSVAQTAQQLGIASGTVKSRTYYGLRSLRSALTEIGITGPEDPAPALVRSRAQ